MYNTRRIHYIQSNCLIYLITLDPKILGWPADKSKNQHSESINLVRRIPALHHPPLLEL